MMKSGGRQSPQITNVSNMHVGMSSHRHTKLSSSSSATMGNTQNSLDAGEEDIGWCAAKSVKEHGQKPKLNFQRRHRKGEKC